MLCILVSGSKIFSIRTRVIQKTHNNSISINLGSKIMTAKTRKWIIVSGVVALCLVVVVLILTELSGQFLSQNPG